jgi:flagellar biosynthesis protein FliQ
MHVFARATIGAITQIQQVTLLFYVSEVLIFIYTQNFMPFFTESFGGCRQSMMSEFKQKKPAINLVAGYLHL